MNKKCKVGKSACGPDCFYSTFELAMMTFPFQRNEPTVSSRSFAPCASSLDLGPSEDLRCAQDTAGAQQMTSWPRFDQTRWR